MSETLRSLGGGGGGGSASGPSLAWRFLRRGSGRCDLSVIVTGFGDNEDPPMVPFRESS